MFLHGLRILNQMVQEGVLDRLVAVTQYPEIMRYAASHSIPARFNPDSSRGISSSISIGLSRFDRNRCLPFSRGRSALSYQIQHHILGYGLDCQQKGHRMSLLEGFHGKSRFVFFQVLSRTADLKRGYGREKSCKKIWRRCLAVRGRTGKGIGRFGYTNRNILTS